MAFDSFFGGIRIFSGAVVLHYLSASWVPETTSAPTSHM